MGKVIGICVLDSCFYCCCYDPDCGFTIPPDLLPFVCPYSPELTMEDFENNIGE